MLAFAAVPAWAETLLSFAETASISVHPDQLVVTLRSEVSSASPADAQARVNAAIAAAVARSRQVPAIEVATGGYNVSQITQPALRWQASQSLDLRSDNAAALLDLVGRLQTQGLLLGDLGWRLSGPALHATQAKARQMALAALRGRAEAAAAVLGLKFTEFRAIRMESSAPQAPRMFGMARAAVPAPVAEPQDIDVTETVAADAVLQPQ